MNISNSNAGASERKKGGFCFTNRLDVTEKTGNITGENIGEGLEKRTEKLEIALHSEFLRGALDDKKL
jgi:hypothetical protein